MLLVLWRRWFNYQNILIIDLVWLILSTYFQDYRGWNWHVFFHVNILFSVRTILNSKYGETDKCHFSCIFKAFCFQYMYTKPQTRRNWQNASFHVNILFSIRDHRDYLLSADNTNSRNRMHLRSLCSLFSTVTHWCH